MAYVDFNTGLHNKSKCDSLIKETGILHPKRMHAAVMFDLNNLKTTNDTYGHQAGDLLILNFAKTIKKFAPKNAFIGRYGGDEFIALFTDTTKDEVLRYLKDIEISINKTSVSKQGLNISYAVGYELSENINPCSFETLLNRADEKMYMDKKRRR